ncbi:PqqD family protein [Solimonas sp. K1W22B-7]|uniref:PqqD family peptide modification chaperone n=1 Tax=Solimonas sp. K1W22B-7 TaxID=2303331 RepID=UPI000E33240A|nr:PqqD family peptide modification chaperone [Solimonas sp. K1W22B-7]AXQ29308.1 PqqD family protein [Solimonas sp. K1W22B-7]
MTKLILTPDTRISRKGDILASKLDHETVLLDVEGGHYYAYDAVGSRIWELIAEPRTMAQLCQALVRQYDIDMARCEREVLAFLEALSAHGLLRCEGDGWEPPRP